MRHCSDTPGSGVENPNDAVAEATVPVGPEVIVTVGAWSTSYAPASHVVPCGRVMPRVSTVRGVQAAMSTAELPTGIVSVGGWVDVSSAAESWGSVCTPPSPHWSALSEVTLPPSSVAAVARLQFAGD